MTNTSSTVAASRPEPPANRTDKSIPQDWFRAALNVTFAILQAVAPFLTQVPGVTDIGTRSDQSPSQFTPPDFSFAIWALILPGMIAFAVFQALPRNLANPLLRQIGWWTAAAMALNAAWELHVVAAGITLTSVAIIFAMGAALLAAFAIVSRTKPLNTIERAVVVVPVSLFAGWITVASLASTLTWSLNAGGFSTGALTQGTVAAILAVIGGCVGATVIWANRGNAIYTMVFVWAFGGIAYKSVGLNESLTLAGALAAITITVGAYTAVVYSQRKRDNSPSLP